MIRKDIAKAYQAVVENTMVDEDEETSTREVLMKISSGLRDILESIDKHLSGSSSRTRLRSGVKTLKIPDEPEGSSWLPSLK